MTSGPDAASARSANVHPADSPALDLEVIAGHPTPEEIAAVTAVLAAMADDASDDERIDTPGVSTWARSSRKLRAPVVPGPGAWTGFSG